MTPEQWHVEHTRRRWTTPAQERDELFVEIVREAVADGKAEERLRCAAIARKYDRAIADPRTGLEWGECIAAAIEVSR